MNHHIISKTPIEGLYLVMPQILESESDLLFETYNRHCLAEKGLNQVFVQENQSYSTKGMLRGLRLHEHYPQGKFVRVASGCIYDVVIDLRVGSRTFGKWFGVELKGQIRGALYIPPDFAHGFLVTSEYAIVEFKVTDFFIQVMKLE